jgi:hypothetical protein
MCQRYRKMEGLVRQLAEMPTVRGKRFLRTMDPNRGENLNCGLFGIPSFAKCAKDGYPALIEGHPARD